MMEIGRRIRFVRQLRAASSKGRRDVAVYKDYGVGKPLARGSLDSLGLRRVKIGGVSIPWPEIERVEPWPDVRCQNCLREHGPLQECFVGVIAGVVVDREGREIKPELLARVHVDEMWDRFGGPAADWLERHLRWLEAQDAV